MASHPKMAGTGTSLPLRLTKGIPRATKRAIIAMFYVEISASAVGFCSCFQLDCCVSCRCGCALGCCEYVSIVSVPAFLCVVAIMPHALISA